MTIHTPERDEAYVAFADTLPVYFAYSTSLRLVKIGFSSNVRQRLASIPSDRRDAGRMALIGWMIGGPQVEAELHDRFVDAHEAREWFYPVAEMADLIDEEGEEGDPPVLGPSDFRVSTRGYWAARSRLAMTDSVDRVLHDFGDGRTFKTREIVTIGNLPASVASRISV